MRVPPGEFTSSGYSYIPGESIPMKHSETNPPVALSYKPKEVVDIYDDEIGASSTRLGVPMALGLFQWVWVVLLAFNTLGWTRPIHLFSDSAYVLMMATPSVAATVTSFRIWRYHATETRRLGSQVVCFLIFVPSLLVASLLVYVWAAFILLDPHGQWTPPGI